MSIQNVIRAWKDPDYRHGLSAAQLAQLPPHPAGAIELRDLSEDAGIGVKHRFSPCRKCSSTVGKR